MSGNLIPIGLWGSRTKFTQGLWSIQQTVISKLASVVRFNLAGRYNPIASAAAPRGFTNIPTICPAVVTAWHSVSGVIDERWAELGAHAGNQLCRHM